MSLKTYAQKHGSLPPFKLKVDGATAIIQVLDEIPREVTYGDIDEDADAGKTAMKYALSIIHDGELKQWTVGPRVLRDIGDYAGATVKVTRRGEDFSTKYFFEVMSKNASAQQELIA